MILNKLTHQYPQANICNTIPASTEQLIDQLSEHGHILIRMDMPLNEDKIIELIGGRENLMSYNEYGTQEREKISGSQFINVTNWRKDLELPPHTELTHHTDFPQYVCFICKQPAQYAGETTIYDCEKAFANLTPSFQQEAMEKNVIFVKKYVKKQNHKKYDFSWEKVLGKNSTAEEAVSHWTKLGYTCSMYQESENGSTIDIVEIQIKRPIAYHYKGKVCLHSSIIGVAPYWYKETWGDKEPQIIVKWEDGNLLSDEQFRNMEKVFRSARIFYNNYQKNDVLILDNLRIAHGRLPFKGERVVGILMGGKASFEFQENKWIVK
ncbi:MAG: TauD/TfdA family dioxygenase [Cyanobacteriota bacterium]|nr:TauD/TfdA family dioxygenase [Cyanobacteriota bacterium]